MDDLVQWLRAQLDDEERTATDRGRLAGDVWTAVEVSAGRWEVVGVGGTVADHLIEWEARHIADHDPASRLLAIAAIRQAVDDYETARKATMIWVDKHLASGNREDGEQAQRRGQYEDKLRLVVEYAALQYAHRPGYRIKWRPVTAPSLPYSEYLRAAEEWRP